MESWWCDLESCHIVSDSLPRSKGDLAEGQYRRTTWGEEEKERGFRLVSQEQGKRKRDEDEEPVEADGPRLIVQ